MGKSRAETLCEQPRHDVEIPRLGADAAAGARRPRSRCMGLGVGGGAVLMLALIGLDLGEVDLREIAQLARDLLGRQIVIVRDREVTFRGDSSFELALGLRNAGNFTSLARGAPRGARRS